MFWHPNRRWNFTPPLWSLSSISLVLVYLTLRIVWQIAVLLFVTDIDPGWWHPFALFLCPLSLSPCQQIRPSHHDCSLTTNQRIVILGQIEIHGYWSRTRSMHHSIQKGGLVLKQICLGGGQAGFLSRSTIWPTSPNWPVLRKCLRKPLFERNPPIVPNLSLFWSTNREKSSYILFTTSQISPISSFSPSDSLWDEGEWAWLWASP